MRLTNGFQIADLQKKGQQITGRKPKSAESNHSYHGHVNAITKSMLKHLQKLWIVCVKLIYPEVKHVDSKV